MIIPPPVFKWSAVVPITDEQYEFDMAMRWIFFGTCGDPDRDARYAREHVEMMHDLWVWESEGGA